MPGVVADREAIEPIGVLLHRAIAVAPPIEMPHQWARLIDSASIRPMTSAISSIEGVATVRRLGQAMAALVVAQDVECVGEIGGLPIPHVQIGGERIGEDQPGCAVRAETSQLKVMPFDLTCIAHP